MEVKRLSRCSGCNRVWDGFLECTCGDEDAMAFWTDEEECTDDLSEGEEYAYVFTLDHVWECYAIDRNYDDDYNVTGVNVKAETIPSEEAVA